MTITMHTTAAPVAITGTAGTLTAPRDADLIRAALTRWYPDSPAGITDAVSQLAARIERGEDHDGPAAHLGVSVTPTRPCPPWCDSVGQVHTDGACAASEDDPAAVLDVEQADVGGDEQHVRTDLEQGHGDEAPTVHVEAGSEARYVSLRLTLSEARELAARLMALSEVAA